MSEYLRLKLLPLTAFTVGMGVMAIEITASRLLAPYFGASLFVWTSLIVTVLLAMSLGYWLGGLLAEREQSLRTLGGLLSGASILLLLGVLVVGDLSKALTGMFVALTNASATLFLGSLSVSTIIFALPVFLLAAAGPIILKEWSKSGEDVGRVAGRYFAVSTIGSAIGTVAPTLLLVPTLGSKRTIEVFALIFFILGAFLVTRKDRRALIGAALTGLLLSFAASPAELPGTLVQIESPYQFIRVSNDKRARYLQFNEGSGIQSIYYTSDARLDRQLYYDYAGLLPLLRNQEQTEHKALIIGFAGGTAARAYSMYLANDRTVKITGVEVDPVVIEVTKKYFAIDEIGADIKIMDGRMFLATHSARYDSILVDAYSTQYYIPAHMATVEFYGLAKTRLNAGGILAMNVNAVDAKSRLLRTLVNSVASNFRFVTVLPVPDAYNWLVFASDEPLDLSAVAAKLPEKDLKLYALKNAFSVEYQPNEEFFTDDRAPIEMLTESMILAEAAKRVR